MDLAVIGAGLGRTGTMSLKLALEQLLDGPCYHMAEVFRREGDIAAWQAVADGDPLDPGAVFDGCRATVDWPAAACWRQLAEAYPDAVVLLSHRPSDAWWRSADRTIFEYLRRPLTNDDPHALAAQEAHRKMVHDLFCTTFTPGYLDRESAIAAYEAHNDAVRAEVPPDRLVEWAPGDGWGPLCTALGVEVPDTDFPHTNSTDEFRQRARFDEPLV